MQQYMKSFGVAVAYAALPAKTPRPITKWTLRSDSDQFRETLGNLANSE